MQEENQTHMQMKTYKRRYAVLFSIFLLNIINATLWVSYAPVATTAEEYYGVGVQMVNLFSLVFQIFTIPFSFIATYCYDTAGLRFGIILGASMNGIGSIIKAIGTAGFIEDRDVQYWVSLSGQSLCGMAQAFILYVPTKVSQLWFPESERALATTAIAMANPLGVVLAMGSIPSIVKTEDDIPLNNYVWMGAAIFVWALILVCITRSAPKTPPSFSAKQEKVTGKYFEQLKSVLTSMPYLLLVFALGCGVGIFNAIATVTQQVLCPVGYSDVFSGIVVAIMILFGFAGSGILGYAAGKTKLFGEITKGALGIAALALVFFFEFCLVPNQEALIIVFAIIFGFVGIGAFPVGLELALEITYPVEETVSSSFVYISGQIQGLIGIVLIPALATGLSSSKGYLNTCSGPIADSAKDYSIPLIVLMTYTSFAICCLIIFMKPSYKRLEAENQEQKRQLQNEISYKI